MPQVGIHIKGLDSLNNKIKRLHSDLKPALRDATMKSVLYVHGTIPPYPPPRPGQRYRRTGNLGRRFTTAVKELFNAIAGVIGNSAAYAPWVISSEHVSGLSAGPQAWFHKDRWYVLQEVVEKARPQIIKFYEQAIDKLVK